MQCGKCGEGLVLEANFCGKCGEEVVTVNTQTTDHGQVAVYATETSSNYCDASLGNAIDDTFSKVWRDIKSFWWIALAVVIGAIATGAVILLVIAAAGGLLLQLILRMVGLFRLGGRQFIGDAEFIDAENALILKTNELNVTVDKFTLITRIASKAMSSEYAVASPKHLLFCVEPVTVTKEKFVPGTVTGRTMDGQPFWGYSSDGGMSYSETKSQGFHEFAIRNASKLATPIDLEFSCSERVADVVKAFRKAAYACARPS